MLSKSAERKLQHADKCKAHLHVKHTRKLQYMGVMGKDLCLKRHFAVNSHCTLFLLTLPVAHMRITFASGVYTHVAASVGDNKYKALAVDYCTTMANCVGYSVNCYFGYRFLLLCFGFSISCYFASDSCCFELHNADIYLDTLARLFWDSARYVFKTHWCLLWVES